MRDTKYKIVKLNAAIFNQFAAALAEADQSIYGEMVPKDAILVVIPFSGDVEGLALGEKDFGDYSGTTVIAETA